MATLRPITSPSAADKPNAADNQPAKRGPRSWLEERLALDARDPTPLAGCRDLLARGRAGRHRPDGRSGVRRLPVLRRQAGGADPRRHRGRHDVRPVIRYATKPRHSRLAGRDRRHAVADRHHERRDHHAGAADHRFDWPRAGAWRGDQRETAIARPPACGVRELQAALGVGAGSGVEVSNSRVLEGVVTIVTPAAVQFAMQLVLFFGTLFFYIIGRAEFRKFAINWFSDAGSAAARAEDPQRHRGQHGRLPDRGHRDQPVARRRHHRSWPICSACRRRCCGARSRSA